MKRKECEKKIRDLMIQIGEVYNEYNPDGTYLSLTLIDGTIMVDNNPHKDTKHPIDIYYRIKRKGK